MKKLLFPFLALTAVCILPACSEKFKVAAPYQNITVVYGLLDRADTAHYIRIQKAFLDDNKSSLAMAQVADSNFYSNINVRIARLNMSDLSLFDTIHLNRVDLDNEGYPKQTGVFFNTPNYAYKFKADLDPSLIYRIIITNTGTGVSDSADAPIIDDINIASFYIYLLDDSAATHQQLDFSNTSVNETQNIIIQYIPIGNFSFQNPTTPVQSTPVYIDQTIIRFNWYDSIGVPGGAKTLHSYDYNLGYEGPNTLDYQVKNSDLFNAIATGLGTAAPNTFRLIAPCEMFVYLGTYDFNEYINVQALEGTGITGNEIQPVYTNVRGKNVLGLYTSRGLRSGLFTLSPRTVLALADSPLTAGAKVRGTAP